MQYLARAIFSFLMMAATNVSADGDFLLEEVTIIGDRDGARTLLGSAALVDSGQVRNEALVDINKILKTFEILPNGPLNKGVNKEFIFSKLA